jgi:hypothetical protein
VANICVATRRNFRPAGTLDELVDEAETALRDALLLTAARRRFLGSVRVGFHLAPMTQDLAELVRTRLQARAATEVTHGRTPGSFHVRA